MKKKIRKEMAEALIEYVDECWKDEYASIKRNIHHYRKIYWNHPFQAKNTGKRLMEEIQESMELLEKYVETIEILKEMR